MGQIPQEHPTHLHHLERLPGAGLATNVTEEGTEMLPVGQDADILDKAFVSVL